MNNVTIYEKDFFDMYHFGYNDAIKFTKGLNENYTKEKERKIIALRMLERKMNINFISDLTHLSKNEIKKLRKIFY